MLLFCLLYYFEHTELTSLMQIGKLPMTAINKGLSAYELSLFFTIFVFLQFWNIFNARAYMTGHSAFRLRGCSGFVLIATVIFIGQILIVTYGGRFFTVVPLTLTDWAIIIFGTSPVVWIGELFRRIKAPTHKKCQQAD